MVKLKSEKKAGFLLTFERLAAKPEKGTFVKAFYKGQLVGVGKNKTAAKSRVKIKTLEALKRRGF